jgi:beta-phosphoglucomutase
VSLPRPAIRAVIFDVDGVIVSTDRLHYQAWKEIADGLGIPFDPVTNERLRGVSRMESLDILLGDHGGAYSQSEKEVLAASKNERYRSFLGTLSPADILPGVMTLLSDLKRRGIRVAVGSSSRNTSLILKSIGLGETFDAVIDGNRIERSKPDPEVFLLAAAELGMQPSECLVFEDARAGVEAAKAAAMLVVGVGSRSSLDIADVVVPDLTDLGILEFFR